MKVLRGMLGAVAKLRAWAACFGILLLAACGGAEIVAPLVTPVLGVTSTSLSVSAPLGDSIVQSFSITGDPAPVGWTASVNVPWIVITPTTGTTPSTVTAVVKTSGLAIGNQSGIITIVTPGGAAPAHVVIALTVTAPTLTVTPTPLSFSGTAGTTLTPQNVSIGTGGSATLQWSASGSATWITSAPASGTGPGSVAVGINAAALGIGTFQGLLTVTAPGASNSPQTVPITVVLSGYTVAVAVSPSGGGTVTGGGTFASGAAVTAVATPASGFDFVDWRDNGTPVSTNATYAFTVTGNRSLVAAFAPRMVTIALSPNPATAGAATGAGSFQEGSSVTVSAAPDVGYAFASWTENGTVVSTSTSYTFTASTNRTLVANFTQIGPGLVAVGTSSNPTAGGVTTGDSQYTPGSTATLTATPNSGYLFTNWTENGSVVSTNASYSFVVTTATQVVANFTAVSGTFTIATSANPVAGGTTTGGGSYPAGTSVTVSGVPATGYIFVNWTENGAIIASTPSIIFTVTASRTLVANFAPTSTTFTITTSSNPAAAGTTSGGGAFTPGANVTVLAFQGIGAFLNWTENGTVVSTSSSYTFAATANRALVANFSNLAMTFVLPMTNQRVGDQLTVSATVTSLFQIASVTAAVGAAQVPLTYNTANNRWQGTINIAGAARDTLTLTGTATDVNGSSVTTTRKFVHDQTPVLTVNSPTNFDVARPSITYSATCADDDPAGCTTIQLFYNNTLLASSSGGSLSGTVSLASYDGRAVTLDFKATDSRAQTVTVSRDINVESSTSVDSLGAAPGQLRDYRGGKALYAWPALGTPVGLYTLSSNVNQPIAIPNALAAGGFVTSAGAIGNANLNTTITQLYEWRNGALTTINNLTYVTASSGYALFGVGTNAYRRDLSTGADVLVSTNAGNIDNSVADNGDVVYWSSAPYEIYRWRSGTSTRLTNNNDVGVWNAYPVTDGVNVVYTKRTPCCDPVLSEIWLHNGTSEIQLSPSRPGYTGPGSDYAVNAGWTAFTKADAGGAVQVWVRSPAGTLTQASAFGAISQIDALGADGTVVFNVNGRRYLTTAGGTSRMIGGAGGKVVWRSGDFIWMIGRVAFRIR